MTFDATGRCDILVLDTYFTIKFGKAWKVGRLVNIDQSSQIIEIADFENQNS